tara:strand:- start:12235 stop:12384 length:150 start_codon:yes stop_codon:yes gene_type:complete
MKPKLDYNFQPPIIKNIPSRVREEYKRMKKYMQRIEEKLSKEYNKRFNS